MADGLPGEGTMEAEALFRRGLRAFGRVNLARALRWHDGNLADWSTLEWAGAMCGEAGEASNVAKKIKRVDGRRTAAAGMNNGTREELVRKYASELAGAFIYLELCAQREGLDLASIVVEEFNRVSEREGFPERI